MTTQPVESARLSHESPGRDGSTGRAGPGLLRRPTCAGRSDSGAGPTASTILPLGPPDAVVPRRLRAKVYSAGRRLRPGP